MEHIRKNDQALETSVVTMTNSKTGQEVCLTSMIHIGKESYYKEIFEVLNKNEEVFYEMIGKSKESTLKSKLILINSLKFSELYKDITTDINQEIKQRISKTMNKVRLEKDNKISHTAEEYNRLIQEVIKQNKVIFQGDMTTNGYNYENLPKHRHNADLNADEITKNTPIFSKENLKALGMKIGLGFVRAARFFGMKFKIDDIMKVAYKKKDEKHLDIHTQREDIVVNKILQSKSKSIGVAYGAGHIESIKQRLIEHGFEEKGDRKYLKAISTDIDLDKQTTGEDNTVKTEKIES